MNKTLSGTEFIRDNFLQGLSVEHTHGPQAEENVSAEVSSTLADAPQRSPPPSLFF